MAQTTTDNSGQASGADYSLSASRALTILSMFHAERPELAISEMSRLLSLSKTSILRFVQTLEMHRYLERDPKTKKYFPSIEVARVGGLYANGGSLNRAAYPILQSLAEEAGFTASLAVLQKDWIIIMSSVEATGPLKYSIPMGSQFSAHSTAAGQAALSALPADEVDSIIARIGLPVRTPKTVTDLPALKRKLRDAQSCGYAINLEEHAPGVGSVAAPIRDRQGAMVAVAALSFATSQINRRDLRTLGEIIVRGTKAIEQNLWKDAETTPSSASMASVNGRAGRRQKR